MDFARARANMVENQLRPNRIDDPSVLEAMGAVPREAFVPKAWQGIAYADEDLLLPDGGFLIEPMAIARMIQAARITPSDVVLVVGCATGYSAAVVAQLASTVILLQPDEVAVKRVEATLDGLSVDNVVTTIGGDPLEGHRQQAPYNVILLIGAVPEVPDTLTKQLGEGGRLVAVIPSGRVGKGHVFTRLHDVVGRTPEFEAHVPPLAGLRERPVFAF